MEQTFSFSFFLCFSSSFFRSASAASRSCSSMRLSLDDQLIYKAKNLIPTVFLLPPFSLPLLQPAASVPKRP
jgi:hypothetical protein